MRLTNPSIQKAEKPCKIFHLSGPLRSEYSSNRRPHPHAQISMRSSSPRPNVRLSPKQQSRCDCDTPISLALDRGEGKAGKSDRPHSDNNDLHADAKRTLSVVSLCNYHGAREWYFYLGLRPRVEKRCSPLCQRRRSLSAEYRMHLYLTALTQGRKTTSI